MGLTFLWKLAIIGSALANSLSATPKYSTPMEKVKPHHIKGPPQQPPLPNGSIKNYVDFDLKSQSSRFGKDEYHHYVNGPYEHYYPSYEHVPYYHGKGQDLQQLLPYIIGGFGILLLPLITLMLTLAVNIAPASNIPTAVTTATGKFLDSFNSTKLIDDLQGRIEEALNKYNQ